MLEFIDVVDFFSETATNLNKGTISLHSPLEQIVLKAAGSNLAYVDNRRDARTKYEYDFWEGLDRYQLRSQGVGERLLYSKSEQFPDFMFKAKKFKGNLTCGSLLELKDSKSGSIASFNSTLPTSYKNLEEVDIVNSTKLVSRIATVMDKGLAQLKSYYTYERRSFYLIRTHRDDNRVKVSLVEGSFFETVPKGHLIYQMFLNVLRAHLEKKDVKLAPEAIRQAEEVLSHITDQTLIAASQIIERASVRPRLRIMSEVHPEGNPHSNFYPQITGESFNLIIQALPNAEELEQYLSQKMPKIRAFTIHHKRNGKHLVFQFKP